MIVVLLFISPYNLFHYFTAESKVTKILADPDVKFQILEDNSEITNIKYIGSNIYYVETKEGTYVMEINKNKSTYTIDVFEHKKHVKQFLN